MVFFLRPSVKRDNFLFKGLSHSLLDLFFTALNIYWGFGRRQSSAAPSLRNKPHDRRQVLNGSALSFLVKHYTLSTEGPWRWNDLKNVTLLQHWKHRINAGLSWNPHGLGVVYQNVRVWLPQGVSRGSMLALDSVRDSISKSKVESDWPRCLTLTSGLHTYVLHTCTYMSAYTPTKHTNTQRKNQEQS